MHKKECSIIYLNKFYKQNKFDQIELTHQNYQRKSYVSQLIYKQRNSQILMLSHRAHQVDRFIPARGHQLLDSCSQQSMSTYDRYIRKNICPQSRVLNYQTCRINKQNYDGNTEITGTNAPASSLHLSLRRQARIVQTWSHRKSKHTQLSHYTDPEKILDVPSTRDDFYLNTLDWSAKGPLGIGLDNQVYVYTPNNIIQLSKVLDGSYVSSVKFHQTILSVGFSDGKVRLYDLQTKSLIREIYQHQKRVAALAFSQNNLMYTGSKDKNILVSDIRIKDATINRLLCHKGQICSLKCQPDQNSYLAAGSNDNNVTIWDLRKHQLVRKYREHKGAVKAISWCPWKSGVIATAGGAGDRTIRLWNVQDSQDLALKRTDSQISALLWSEQSGTLISSHGHSNNEINFWMPELISNRALGLENVKVLKGHNGRILNMAMSPAQNMICSLSSDQTLRFWRFVDSDQNAWQEKEVRKTTRWSLKLK